LGSNVPALHDYGEMVCGSCMERHTFLWQYKKEIPDQDGVVKVEACSGTVETVENGNEMKIDDSKSKIIKTEDRGKSICCMRHRVHIATKKFVRLSSYMLHSSFHLLHLLFLI
jgi:hypothetical protein